MNIILRFHLKSAHDTEKDVVLSICQSKNFSRPEKTSTTILNTLRQPLVKLKFLQFKTKIKGLSLQRRIFFFLKKNSHFNS